MKRIGYIILFNLENDLIEYGRSAYDKVAYHGMIYEIKLVAAHIRKVLNIV